MKRLFYPFESTIELKIKNGKKIEKVVAESEIIFPPDLNIYLTRFQFPGRTDLKVQKVFLMSFQFLQMKRKSRAQGFDFYFL
jgi:hypothetical protein